MKDKIRNTARLRTGSVTRKSFNDAARLNYQKPDSGDYLKNWNKFVPLTPKQTMEILTRGLPKNVKVQLKIDDGGKGELNFKGPGIEDVSAGFDLVKRVRNNGSAFIDAGAQGRGLGRKLVRNQIEFLHACGIEKFEVGAGSTAGGYSWARFGYLPDRLSGNLFDTAKERINKNYALLRPLLAKAEREALDRAVQLRTKKDIWKLADARIDLSARLKDKFNRAALPENHQALFRNAYGESLQENKYATDALKKWVDDGKSVLLSRLLLSNTAWNGIIKLNNREQMRRVADYTGGFKYLNLE